MPFVPTVQCSDTQYIKAKKEKSSEPKVRK